ncbi:MULTISPECIES: LacI family DNA-binding transcriptional regulator [Enterococcus]|uniref:LacI family DNA-binding transcriptional regulator n=1 Tax=Enterococcus TaxID=1350 RepID=UPI001C0F3F02|nr:LacI family DNA-binding transcriptional regulator [Enterococcus devriesei]MBU5366760.1 substrate-binding domain-containing protein [Enterococcus devriesei]
MVTIRDIAKKSGYSTATISRLFKGDESLSITSDTKNKIIVTAKSLGYDLTKIKTTLYKIAILFWISEEQLKEDIYYQHVKDDLKKYSKKANLDLIFISKNDGVKSIPDDITGFIAIGQLTKKELYYLNQKGYKGVIRGINPLPEHFDTVEPDFHEMARQAINYFINEGFTKIGFIGGNFFNLETGKEEIDSREYAFRYHLEKSGLLNEKYIFSQGSFTVDEGYQLSLKMKAELNEDMPEACFIPSDTIAAGVLQGCHELGINIPKDMAVISINDDDIAKFVAPPLTTFKIDIEEIAKTCVDLLSDQLVYSRDISKKTLIGAKLTVRKSFIPKEEV